MAVEWTPSGGERDHLMVGDWRAGPGRNGTPRDSDEGLTIVKDTGGRWIIPVARRSKPPNASWCLGSQIGSVASAAV